MVKASPYALREPLSSDAIAKLGEANVDQIIESSRNGIVSAAASALAKALPVEIGRKAAPDMGDTVATLRMENMVEAAHSYQDYRLGRKSEQDVQAAYTKVRQNLTPFAADEVIRAMQNCVDTHIDNQLGTGRA